MCSDNWTLLTMGIAFFVYSENVKNLTINQNNNNVLTNLNVKVII